MVQNPIFSILGPIFGRAGCLVGGRDRRRSKARQILRRSAPDSCPEDSFCVRQRGPEIPKSAILTSPPKTINFNTKALTDRTLFGQIGTDSILACFFLVFTNQFILKNVMYFQLFHKKNITKSPKLLKYDKDFLYF